MKLKGMFSVTQRPEIQKIYTVQEIADLLETSCETVRNITNHYKVEHKIESTKKSRAAIYTYDAMRQIEAYYKERQRKAIKKTKKVEEVTEVIEGAELHPLVTDKRCLKLSWWPDIVPECFKVEAE